MIIVDFNGNGQIDYQDIAIGLAMEEESEEKEASSEESAE